MWYMEREVYQKAMRSTLALKKAVSKCIGSVASGHAHRSENAKRDVRERLRRRRKFRIVPAKRP